MEELVDQIRRLNDWLEGVPAHLRSDASVGNILQRTQTSVAEVISTLERQEAKTASDAQSEKAALELLSSVRKELATTSNQLAAARKDLAINGNELAVARKDLAINGNELAVARKDLAINGNELATARRDLAAAHSELAITRNELVVARNGLVTNSKELAASRKQLTVQKTQSDAALARNETRLAESKDHEDRLREYNQTLEIQLAGSKSREGKLCDSINALETRLAKSEAQRQGLSSSEQEWKLEWAKSQAQLVDLKERQDKLRSSKEAFEAKSAKLGTILTEREGREAGLRKSNKAYKTKLEELQRDFDRKVANESRLSLAQLEARCLAHKRDLEEAFASNVAEASEAVHQENSRVLQRYDLTVGAVNQHLTAMESRLATLSGDVATIQSDVAAGTAHAHKMVGDVGDLRRQGKLQVMGITNLTYMGSDLIDRQSRMESVQADQGRVQAEQAAVQANQHAATMLVYNDGHGAFLGLSRDVRENHEASQRLFQNLQPVPAALAEVTAALDCGQQMQKVLEKAIGDLKRSQSAVENHMHSFRGDGRELGNIAGKLQTALDEIGAKLQSADKKRQEADDIIHSSHITLSESICGLKDGVAHTRTDVQNGVRQLKQLQNGTAAQIAQSTENAVAHLLSADEARDLIHALPTKEAVGTVIADKVGELVSKCPTGDVIQAMLNPILEAVHQSASRAEQFADARPTTTDMQNLLAPVAKAVAEVSKLLTGLPTTAAMKELVSPVTETMASGFEQLAGTLAAGSAQVTQALSQVELLTPSASMSQSMDTTSQVSTVAFRQMQDGFWGLAWPNALEQLRASFPVVRSDGLHGSDVRKLMWQLIRNTRATTLLRGLFSVAQPDHWYCLASLLAGNNLSHTRSNDDNCRFHVKESCILATAEAFSRGSGTKKGLSLRYVRRHS